MIFIAGADRSGTSLMFARLVNQALPSAVAASKSLAYDVANELLFAYDAAAKEVVQRVQRMGGSSESLIIVLNLPVWSDRTGRILKTAANRECQYVSYLEES